MGVPIITHTQEGTMGPEQASLLVEAGADPKKKVFSQIHLPSCLLNLYDLPGCYNSSFSNIMNIL